MSCVRPGVLLTKASRRRPASALIALDLPAFERPANASSGAPGGGSSSGSCTESAKVAFANARARAPRARVVASPARATVKFRGFGPSFASAFPPRGFSMRAFTGLGGVMLLVYASLTAAAEPAPAKPDLARGQQ